MATKEFKVVLNGRIVRQTEKAYLWRMCSLDGQETEQRVFWIPKSESQLSESETVLTITQWIADMRNLQSYIREEE